MEYRNWEMYRVTMEDECEMESTFNGNYDGKQIMRQPDITEMKARKFKDRLKQLEIW